MLKIVKNDINLVGDWSTSNYQYDSDSYNYDEVDLTDIASISTAYIDICALSNSTQSIVGGLGNISNGNNVQNVDLSGMDTEKACVGGINAAMDTMMTQYGNFVNSCYANIGSNGALFSDQDGNKIDDYAAYLRDYAKSGSLNDVVNSGFEGLKMSDFGNFISADDADASNRPHFEGDIILEDGSLNPEYEAYVNATFYDENGNCKFDGVSIKDLNINPANGNVQVDFVDDDGIPFTLNCNLANPNALDNAYVSLPGDSGGAVYGSDNYSKVLNNVQFNSTNKYISFIFGAPTDHPAANAAMTQIVDALNGETNLNKSVVSAASASEIYALDAVEALMYQSDSVDVMLLDSVRPGSEVCENFTKMLLGDKLKDTTIRNGKVIVNGYYRGKDYSDVLAYLQENGTVYAYVAQRGNSPSNAGSWLQQLANNGVPTVMCTNNNYPAHVDVEYQIFNGELERVFNEFQELPSSNNNEGIVLIANVQLPTEEENPYANVNGINQSKLNCQDDNNYTIFGYKTSRSGDVQDVAALHTDTMVTA